MPDSTEAGPAATVAARPSTIKVAIIEDMRDIREGLAVLINGTPGYRCTGVFPSMEAALATIDRDLPAVALIDIGLPGMSGIEGMRILKDRHSDLLMIMLTVYNDDERIFDALCAGACGYLLKNTPPARLLASLEEVVMGGSPMSPEIARRVVTLFRDIRPSERSD
jgi:DNA-binding NarL/FixJ family response regulator